MAVTFTKKPYVCSSCGEDNYELFAVKYISDISSEYPMNSRPEILKESGIYVEILTRDEYGIILSRVVKEKTCPSCGNFSLDAKKIDNETTVLNFYPKTDAHKWLDGLAKAGL